jgi:hypothetical protein
LDDYVNCLLNEDKFMTEYPKRFNYDIAFALIVADGDAIIPQPPSAIYSEKLTEMFCKEDIHVEIKGYNLNEDFDAPVVPFSSKGPITEEMEYTIYYEADTMPGNSGS